MTALNLRSLPQRWGSALIDIFAVACVVAVFVGLFSVVASYQALLVSGGDDAVLMVMKSGAGAENESSIAQDQAGRRCDGCQRGGSDGAHLARKFAADQREAAAEPRLCDRCAARRGPNAHLLCAPA